MTPPFAQLRVRSDFPNRENEHVEVLVNGEPVARLHPTLVNYRIDYGSGGCPKVTVEFIGGPGEFETRPAMSNRDRA